MNLLQWITALGLGSALGSLIGIGVTSWLTSRRDRETRRAGFKKEQLEKFYGPLLALHREIRARSDLRVKLQNAIDSQHIQAMLEAGPKRTEEASDTHLPAILTNIRDENETFREVLMPRYRDMLTIFREKMWLAEPETRAFYNDLVEFVDVWDKILADKLPRSVAPAIGHSETNLKPFYQHLEQVHDRLRSEVH